MITTHRAQGYSRLLVVWKRPLLTLRKTRYELLCVACQEPFGKFLFARAMRRKMAECNRIECPYFSTGAWA